MEAQPGIFPSLKLNVFTPSGVEEISFPHQEIVPKQAELYAYLEEELMKLANMLRALVESTRTSNWDTCCCPESPALSRWWLNFCAGSSRIPW
jgi:hypothetical protein